MSKYDQVKRSVFPFDGEYLTGKDTLPNTMSMNPINQKIKEQGERFDEHIRSAIEEYGASFPPEIKSFLTQSQHELLDTVVEVLKKSKSTLCSCENPNGEMNRCQNCYLVLEDKRTANEVLDHAIQLLKEGKE